MSTDRIAQASTLADLQQWQAVLDLVAPLGAEMPSAEGWQLLVRAHDQLQQPAQMRAVLKKGLAAYPQDMVLRCYDAASRHLRGETVAAVAALEGLIGENPDYLWPYAQLARIQEELRDVAGASRWLEKALAQAPGEVWLLARWVDLLQRRKPWGWRSKANHLLALALKQAPNDPELLALAALLERHPFRRLHLWWSASRRAPERGDIVDHFRVERARHAYVRAYGVVALPWLGLTALTGGLDQMFGFTDSWFASELMLWLLCFVLVPEWAKRRMPMGSMGRVDQTSTMLNGYFVLSTLTVLCIMWRSGSKYEGWMWLTLPIVGSGLSLVLIAVAFALLFALYFGVHSLISLCWVWCLSLRDGWRQWLASIWLALRWAAPLLPLPLFAAGALAEGVWRYDPVLRVLLFWLALAGSWWQAMRHPMAAVGQWTLCGGLLSLMMMVAIDMLRREWPGMTGIAASLLACLLMALLYRPLLKAIDNEAFGFGRVIGPEVEDDEGRAVVPAIWRMHLLAGGVIPWAKSRHGAPVTALLSLVLLGLAPIVRFEQAGIYWLCAAFFLWPWLLHYGQPALFQLAMMVSGAIFFWSADWVGDATRWPKFWELLAYTMVPVILIAVPCQVWSLRFVHWLSVPFANLVAWLIRFPKPLPPFARALAFGDETLALIETEHGSAAYMSDDGVLTAYRSQYPEAPLILFCTSDERAFRLVKMGCQSLQTPHNWPSRFRLYLHWKNRI